MSGNHLVSTHRNHIAIMIDLMHNSTESVQFRKIFSFHHKIFTIQANQLPHLSDTLNQNFLMLTSKELTNAVHS